VKPVVALIGRPNVGKSTLFNRLTRSRAALVADEPGVTRDRQYGDGRVGDRAYFVVDTGGLTPETADALRARGATSLVSQVAEQTRLALAEADTVIFIVDGREGLTALDEEIAHSLRRSGKPLTVAVNKAEGMIGEAAVAEFHRLGLGTPFPVSSAHGEGVTELMQAVLGPLPIAAEAEVPGDLPRIAVVGRPNAGKSTLVNTLLGEQRVVVSPEAGTTRDSIEVALTKGGRDYMLIDTAGLRRRHRVEAALEKFSALKTLAAIEAANVALLVMDAGVGVGEHEVALAGYVFEHGRALVVAVNKWDLLEPGARDWFKQELDRKFPFLDVVDVHYISALEARGLDQLFDSINRAFRSAQYEFPTPKLNRVLEAAVAATPPPVVHGRRIRPKYAHQAGKNPPTVIVHGNLVSAMPKPYRRYLANAIRRGFHLTGTPVRIECRQADNPYAVRNPVRTAKKRHRPRRHV
jgi:GTP-binding protein